MRAVIAFAISIFASVASAQDYATELAAIRLVESSNGLNTNHALMTSGMHAGTRAGGEYGIMPITAKEMIARSPRLYKTLSKYVDITNTEMTAELNNNRKFDKMLAKYMWTKLRSKMTADEAACAWYRGQNHQNCFDPVKLEQDPYVAKFKDAMREIQLNMIAKR